MRAGGRLAHALLHALRAWLPRSEVARLLEYEEALADEGLADVLARCLRQARVEVPGRGPSLFLDQVVMELLMKVHARDVTRADLYR